LIKTAWVLSVALWFASAPLLATSPSSQEQGQDGSEDQISRAEEWTARRHQKSRHIVSPKARGFEKALLFLEGGGFEQALTIRYKDFYPKFGQISTSSGTALGLRYFKSRIGSSPLTLETSAAASFTGYRQADLHFGLFGKIAPHFFLGPAVFGAPFQFGDNQPEQVRSFLYTQLQYRYSPRETFYGLGQDTSLENQTDFLLEEGLYSMVAGHQFNRWLGAGARVGYVTASIGRGTDQNFPDIQGLFDDVSAPGLERQPDFLRFDSALYLDSRNTPGNPHQGGVLGLAYSRIDDRGGDEFEFNRLSLDARAYLPLGSRQRILAMRLYGAWDDARDGSRIPFYMQQTLGGKETLRGFREFRFRDSNQFHFSVEYRWEAAPAFETALFYDTGKVFSERDTFEFNHLHKSIGIGFRFKRSQRLLFRLDIAQSTEGTRIHFQFGPSF
jgi:hypothetical protein